MASGSYGIITSVDNAVTTVIARSKIFIIFRMARPVARTHSRRFARFGSRAVRIDLQFAPQPQHLNVDAAIETWVSM